MPAESSQFEDAPIAGDPKDVRPDSVGRALREIGERAAGAGHGEPGGPDLAIWAERSITSHRPWIGKFYVFLRRWFYREIVQSVEPPLRRQEQVNRWFLGKMRSLEANLGGTHHTQSNRPGQGE